MLQARKPYFTKHRIYAILELQFRLQKGGIFMPNDTVLPALEIKRLSKAFGKRPILHDISFSVKQGEIFGFVGPNGSGKTTTIKLILGLLKLEVGEIRISGKSLKEDFEGAIEHVGGIIENPEMYKYLTGRQNLMQYLRMYDDLPDSRIDEVADIVRLSGRLDDKVSSYSLGMRQRLGLAQAILCHPKLLVLDEPTNGLDPAGIKDLRDILKYLASEEDCAVFISSHLLSELEMICDTVGIIDRGYLVDVRSIGELRACSDNAREKYHITAPQVEEMFSIAAEHALECEKTADGITVAATENEIKELVKAIVLANIPILGAVPVQRSLEDAFIEKTTNNTIGGVGI